MPLALISRAIVTPTYSNKMVDVISQDEIPKLDSAFLFVKVMSL